MTTLHLQKLLKQLPKLDCPIKKRVYESVIITALHLPDCSVFKEELNELETILTKNNQ